jgi:hypothetical protein
MSGNVRWLQIFYHHTVRLAFKWINRRSQRKSYNWDQFLIDPACNSILEKHHIEINQQTKAFAA